MSLIVLRKTCSHLVRFPCNFSLDWQDILQAVIELTPEDILLYSQTPWSSSKIFRCMDYFQLSSRCLKSNNKPSFVIYEITTCTWMTFWNTRFMASVHFCRNLFGQTINPYFYVFETCLLITKYDNGTKALQLYVTDLIACGHAHQWFSTFWPSTSRSLPVEWPWGPFYHNTSASTCWISNSGCQH